MTTPEQPDVRAAMVDALNMFVDRRHAEAYADHILAAVTPVIRRQVAEEIAKKIDEEVEFETRRVHPSAFAIDAFRDAAAIARSHSQPTEETNRG